MKLDPSEFDAVLVTLVMESHSFRHRRRRRFCYWLGLNFLFAQRRGTFLYFDALLESLRKRRRETREKKFGGAKLESSKKTNFCEKEKRKEEVQDDDDDDDEEDEE